MSGIIDGGCVLLGYFLYRLACVARSNMELPSSLDEAARHTVEQLVSQDELALRYSLQLRILATAILGAVVVISTVGIMILSFIGREIPPALSAVGGTAIGALVASLNNNPKR